MSSKSPIKKIIFEETEQPEASEGEIFGQYLFPAKRKLSVKEPDTEKEQDFFLAIQDFIGGDITGPINKWESEIRDLMAKHAYKQVLDPGHKVVFRGNGFNNISTDSKLLTTIGLTPEKLKTPTSTTEGEPLFSNYYTAIWNWYEHEFNLNPPGSRKVQSWSSDVIIAQQFALSRKHNFIYKTKTDKPGALFFGKPGELAAITYFSNADEMETISIGPVPCEGIYINRQTINQLIASMAGGSPDDEDW